MGLATVFSDIAPLYEKPSVESARLDEALYGMSVQVMQESNTGWCYVRTEHNTEGYTPTACLETDVDVASAWRKYKKVTVLAPYVDVMKEASHTAGRLASLPRGGILVPLGKAGVDGWQKVGLTSGTVGYTCASYLGEVIADWNQIAEADLRWNIVETALSYNGTAYRAGGRTPLGMDAVGLVAMSYLLNGILIWHETFLKPGLALHGIKTGAMREGDVLFFRDSVGIYLGEEKFVHATDRPGAEGVAVSSLRKKDKDYRADLASHIAAVGSVF